MVDREDHSRFMPMPARRSFHARCVDIGIQPAQDRGRRVVCVHLVPDADSVETQSRPADSKDPDGRDTSQSVGHVQTASLLRCGVARLVIRTAYLPVDLGATVYPAQAQFIAQDWLRCNRYQGRTWPYTEQEALDLIGISNRLLA